MLPSNTVHVQNLFSNGKSLYHDNDDILCIISNMQCRRNLNISIDPEVLCSGS